MDSVELARKIRRNAVEMTHTSHGSHIASALSMADIVAVLYNDVMRISPNDSKNDLRDRFILSKGHSGVAVYAALGEKGFLDKELFKTYYLDGSDLSGHVSHKNVPGVEFSTGSLGHGLGAGIGMAMAGKINQKKYRVFVIVGDGECNEGSIWEGALFANQYRLSSLCVIVDHNKMQAMGDCEDVMSIAPIADKWKAFGWNVSEVDGHDHQQLKKVLTAENKDKPLCVIAHTIKGKGVSFMENNLLWHYRDPQGEFYEKAVNELGEMQE